MKKFLRAFHYGQRGFTLIELLIVVAILGILAAVIIPNVTSFMTTGTLNAANTEAENVKTASLAYFAEKSEWPPDSDTLTGDYITGTLRAKYTFDAATGFISAADASVVTNGWPDSIEWIGTLGSMKWVRATTP